MKDAEHLREQALVCANIAFEMSDVKDREALRQQALEYTKRAEAIEEQQPELPLVSGGS